MHLLLGLVHAGCLQPPQYWHLGSSRLSVWPHLLDGHQLIQAPGSVGVLPFELYVAVGGGPGHASVLLLAPPWGRGSEWDLLLLTGALHRGVSECLALDSLSLADLARGGVLSREVSSGGRVVEGGSCQGRASGRAGVEPRLGWGPIWGRKVLCLFFYKYLFPPGILI